VWIVLLLLTCSPVRAMLLLLLLPAAVAAHQRKGASAAQRKEKEVSGTLGNFATLDMTSMTRKGTNQWDIRIKYDRRCGEVSMPFH
jgi:hypothetical protein